MPLGRKALKPKISHHPYEGLAVADVLGCNIHCVGMDEALAIAERFLSERTPHHIVTADASAVVIAQRDEEFRSILNTADLVVPDSNGVVWACRMLGYPVRERVAGVDLMDRLCRLAAERGFSAFFYGAAPGVAEAAAKNLEAAYPGLRVVGTMHGYAPDSEESSIVARIRALRPDMLFVALGIPRQEKWIHRNKQALGVPLAMGVGGSLDCFSGRVKRAPVWLRERGLEWAYRLAKDPRKFRKVAMLPHFALMVLLQSVSRRR